MIIELKRDSTPREAVAQSLDYASWLDSTTAEEFAELAEEYLQIPLAQAFAEHFLDLDDLPEIDCHNHRIILVAPKLDAAAERMINYLATRYGVAINAVFFKYAQLGSEEILVRSVLVSEEAKAKHLKNPAKPKWVPVESLLGIAKERNVTSIADICRRITVEASWDEIPSAAHGGSWMYALQTPKGWRSLVGVNVSGKLMATPAGELDVWIRAKNLAEVSGTDESAIRKILAVDYPELSEKSGNCIIRLRTIESRIIE